MQTLPILYFIPLALAVLGALLVLFPRLVAEEAFSVVFSFGALIASGIIAFSPNHFDHFVYVDGFSKLMLLLISLVWAAAVLYSIAYLPHIKNPLFHKRYFFFLLNSFMAVMLSAVTMDNLGLVWFSIEATTVTGALLVATDNSESAVEASWRFIIIVSSGLVIALIACIFLYSATGTLSLTELKEGVNSSALATTAALLAVVGFGTKGGLFPMFTWLPDVHGKAPSPISAILSALNLPVAIFAMTRFLGVAPFPLAKEVLFIMALITLVVATFLLSVQSDLKRLFAYSTIENMGIIMVGISLGGIGAIGAVLIILSHGVSKSAAFFLSGNVVIEYGTVRIASLRGIGKRLPATGLALFFSALSVTGAPPFLSFFGELIILGAIWARYGALLALIVGTLIALSFMALNFKVAGVVFSPTNREKSPLSPLSVVVPIVILIVGFILLFFVPAIEEMLKGALGL